MRTGDETLPGLVPTQGKQNFLALSGSSQRRFPDELPVRLKKNRYQELLRGGYSFEDQEGLHFQAMICAAKLQRGLLSRTRGCRSASERASVCFVCGPEPCVKPTEHPRAGQATRGDNRARSRIVVLCRGQGSLVRLLTSRATIWKSGCYSVLNKQLRRPLRQVPSVDSSVSCRIESSCLNLSWQRRIAL